MITRRIVITSLRPASVMAKYLTHWHQPGYLEQFIENFKKRFPTRQDAERDFQPEMLAVDLGGPYAWNQQMRDDFHSDFALLSDEHKNRMKNIHIENYYSDNPKPMVFLSGTTTDGGGEVLDGQLRAQNGDEFIVVNVLCNPRSQ